MSTAANPNKKIQFRASKDGHLLSAMAALSKMEETQAKRPAESKKPVTKKLKQKTTKGKDAGAAEDSFVYDWPKCVCGMNHPPVPFFKKPDKKRCSYYWQIADMFPLMTLHRVLMTEIKFIEADKDQSGVIELNEMKDLLKGLLHEETNVKTVKKIFNQVDTDGSGNLDFTEVLTVIEGILQRRNLHLPTQVQSEVSKTCVIQ